MLGCYLNPRAWIKIFQVWYFYQLLALYYFWLCKLQTNSSLVITMDYGRLPSSITGIEKNDKCRRKYIKIITSSNNPCDITIMDRVKLAHYSPLFQHNKVFDTGQVSWTDFFSFIQYHQKSYHANPHSGKVITIITS